MFSVRGKTGVAFRVLAESIGWDRKLNEMAVQKTRDLGADKTPAPRYGYSNTTSLDIRKAVDIGG